MRSNNTTAPRGNSTGELSSKDQRPDRLWLIPDRGLGTTGGHPDSGIGRRPDNGALLLDKLHDPSASMRYSNPTDRLWSKRAVSSTLFMVMMFGTLSAQLKDGAIAPMPALDHHAAGHVHPHLKFDELNNSIDKHLTKIDEHTCFVQVVSIL